ncbi:hypothetical protein [Eikenella sp. NML96-A-049]|nr:hypothetical protein [Eikenella sp. NML96-A-049]
MGSPLGMMGLPENVAGARADTVWQTHRREKRLEFKPASHDRQVE